MVAWIEPGIGDHLATSTQHFWRRHLRQQRGGQRLADTDDAEQQVAFAAQLVVLLDRLTNGLVDCLDLGGEMLDRRGGQAGRDAVAEAAADAVPPLCPVVDDAGAYSLEFAQPPHRRGRRCPWSRLEQSGVFADQNGIDFVSLVAAQLGAGEVTDLSRVDDADDVAGGIKEFGTRILHSGSRWHACSTAEPNYSLKLLPVPASLPAPPASAECGDGHAAARRKPHRALARTGAPSCLTGGVGTIEVNSQSGAARCILADCGGRSGEPS